MLLPFSILSLLVWLRLGNGGKKEPKTTVRGIRELKTKCSIVSKRKTTPFVFGTWLGYRWHMKQKLWQNWGDWKLGKITFPESPKIFQKQPVSIWRGVNKACFFFLTFTTWNVWFWFEHAHWELCLHCTLWSRQASLLNLCSYSASHSQRPMRSQLSARCSAVSMVV